MDTNWLSNVEISTHSPYLRPLWAVPQFTFKTFHPPNPSPLNLNSSSNSNSNFFNPLPSPSSSSPSPSSSSSSSSTSSGSRVNGPSISGASIPLDARNTLYDDSVPTKKVDIRRFAPMPFKESLDDRYNPLSGGHAEEVLAPATEDAVKENIMAAISTPMVKEDLQKEDHGVKEIDHLLMGESVRPSAPPLTNGVVGFTKPLMNVNFDELSLSLPPLSPSKPVTPTTHQRQITTPKGPTTAKTTTTTTTTTTTKSKPLVDSEDEADSESDDGNQILEEDE